MRVAAIRRSAISCISSIAWPELMPGEVLPVTAVAE